MTPIIKSRYNAYVTIEQRHRNMIASHYSDDEKDALLHLYSSKTATACQIIDDVVGAQLAIQAGCCLSCGIGEADQIDHFLPKEHFPEFSILHKNLVPICGLCNEIKSSHIPGINNKDFIHPMYDSIPGQAFLDCTITYINSNPVVQFTIKPAYIPSRVYDHFVSLDLSARLSAKAIQYCIQIKAFKTDISEIFAQEEIERELQKLRISHGAQSWKYVLCEEMLATNFIQQV